MVKNITVSLENLYAMGVCRPCGTRLFDFRFPALTCRAFLYRRFAAAMGILFSKSWQDFDLEVAMGF